MTHLLNYCSIFSLQIEKTNNNIVMLIIIPKLDIRLSDIEFVGKY